MKKIKIILLVTIMFLFTGCFRNDSMENINIITSVYPIEYIVNYLYGNHSAINNMYPSDSEIIDFEVTDILLEQYSNNDLFIFNGLSQEKDYIKAMKEKNKDLKIINASENLEFNYSIEELWLDPNKLLTIAYNIKKGFSEYIKSTYLINEINEKYDELKIEITSLDGKYYSTAKNSSSNTIIVSDDAFKYLEKYGIKVISLDSDTVTQKDIENAKECIDRLDCKYIFIKYGEQTNDTINNIINGKNITKLELYTMTNLYNINIDNNSYITLMNQNLESLKLELYK